MYLTESEAIIFQSCSGHVGIAECRVEHKVRVEEPGRARGGG